MLHSLDAMDRALRLNADKLHAGFLFLEESTCPDKRSRCPKACDEMGEGSPGLPPDLGSGRIEVRAPVRFVVVLIEVPIHPGLRGEKSLRSLLGSVRALLRGREDKVRAVGLEDPPSLRIEVPRHAQRDVVSLRGAEHRDRDSRVSR